MIKPPIVYRKRVKEEEAENYGPKWIENAFKDHIHMSKRLTKTLYYGKQPKTDRPSLPMTEIAVEMFSESSPKSLDDIDLYFASSVSRNACMSPCSLILAMAYLERLRVMRPEYLQNMSSSNLFLVSMLVASKFLYDEGEDEEVFNDEWAEAATMETDELNDLEMKFLSAIDWNVSMNSSKFHHLLAKLERTVAKRKSKDRGWCTYTDLDLLTDQLDYYQCWHILCDLVIKVVAVSAVAYVASVMVMVVPAIGLKHLEQTTIIKRIFESKSSGNLMLCDIKESVSQEVINNSYLLSDSRWEMDLPLNLSLPPVCITNSLLGKQRIMNVCSDKTKSLELLESVTDNLKEGKVNSTLMTNFFQNVSPFIDLTVVQAFR